MEWKKIFLKLVRNIAVSTLISAMVMGIIGYLLAGKAGLANSILLGALFGFIGSLMISGIHISAHFWSGYANRYGQSQFDKISKLDEQDDSENPGKRRPY